MGGGGVSSVACGDEFFPLAGLGVVGVLTCVMGAPFHLYGDSRIVLVAVDVTTDAGVDVIPVLGVSTLDFLGG